MALDGHMDEWQAADFWKLIAGPKLGEGVYRRTFECALDPSLVIKVEQEEGCFANIHEWEVWRTWSDHAPTAKWLAPCVKISPNGKFLLQKRTKPLDKDNLPKQLPNFLADRKTGNYGMIGKQVVCHDYAFVFFKTNLTMGKVHWTDVD